MFKIGDRVVCINTKFNGKWGKVELLKSHKIYTIDDISRLHKLSRIGLKGENYYLIKIDLYYYQNIENKK